MPQGLIRHGKEAGVYPKFSGLKRWSWKDQIWSLHFLLLLCEKQISGRPEREQANIWGQWSFSMVGSEGERKTQIGTEGLRLASETKMERMGLDGLWAHRCLDIVKSLVLETGWLVIVGQTDRQEAHKREAKREKTIRHMGPEKWDEDMAEKLWEMARLEVGCL